MTDRFLPTGNIRVDAVSHKKSKFGLISKKILPQGEIHELCYVSDKTKIVECSINICNIGSFTANVRLWLSFESQPSDVDIFEPLIVIKPNEVFIRQTIWLSAGEKVFLQSDQPDVIVRLDGYDERKF